MEPLVLFGLGVDGWRGEIQKMALQIADGTNYGGALGGGGGKDINRVSVVVNGEGDYAMMTDALFGEWAFGTTRGSPP